MPPTPTYPSQCQGLPLLISYAAVGDMEAFVTLVTSESYVDGACVLAHSLRRTGTHKAITCTYTDLTEQSRYHLFSSVQRVFGFWLSCKHSAFGVNCDAVDQQAHSVLTEIRQ